jgi:hypothetical protein
MTTATQPSNEDQAAPQLEADTPLSSEEYEREFDAMVATREGSAPPQNEAAPPAEVVPSGEAAAPTDVDPLSLVPEGSREAVKKAIAEREARIADLDHKYKSAQGRIKVLEARTVVPAKSAAPRSSAPSISKEEQARIDNLVSNYPEIAAGVDARIKQGLEQSSSRNDLLQYVAREKETREMDQKIVAVSAAYPGFDELIRDDRFDKWAEQQSPKVKALVNSSDPEDLVIALNLYSPAKSTQPSDTPQPQAGAGAGAPAGHIPKPETAEQAALRKRREAQLGGAEAGGSTGRGLPQDISTDDEDALWDFYMKKADSKLAESRR